jgi:hypothetical protein
MLAFMQADNNKKIAAEEKRKKDQKRKDKARKKRAENEGQEGGIIKKQKVANGGRGGGRGGGRSGGRCGRDSGAGGRGAKKGLLKLGLGGSEETGDEEEEVPLHDSSCKAEHSGDGEGGGLAEPVTTRLERKVVPRNRTDE